MIYLYLKMNIDILTVLPYNLDICPKDLRLAFNETRLRRETEVNTV